MISLEELQKAFLGSLTAPLEGEDRGRTPFRHKLPDHHSQRINLVLEHITPSEKLSAEERFGLYHRQYWFRLIDSIADDFPVIRKMLGEELFWEIIEKYLLAFPPDSFTLFDAGKEFVNWLIREKPLPDKLLHWTVTTAWIEYAKLDLFRAASGEPVKNPSAITISPTVMWKTGDSRCVHLYNDPEKYESFPDEMIQEDALIVVGRQPDYSLVVLTEPLELLPLLVHLKAGYSLQAFFETHEILCESWEPSMIEGFFSRWNSRGWFSGV